MCNILIYFQFEHILKKKIVISFIYVHLKTYSIYKEGAILAPHVDRLPLVTSCIINVAQDLDNPWPIEVYSRDGQAHNVTMMPGDMVMYESHTTIHGRPAPLDGRYFANVFVHFEPIDEYGKRKNEGSSETMKYPPPHKDANRKKGLRATLDENHEKYYQHHPHEDSEAVEEAQELSAAFATGSTSLHVIFFLLKILHFSFFFLTVHFSVLFFKSYHLFRLLQLVVIYKL